MVFGCTGAQVQQNNTKLQAVASFYPVYDITKAVGGDLVEAISLVPSGVEPHEYEPTPKEIENLNNAEVFVILGTNFAEFEHDLEHSMEGKLKVINAGEGVFLINASEEEHEEEEIDEGHAEEDEQSHSGTDPHIWLSPKNMIKMSQNVRDGLVESDTKNAENYKENADAYIVKLQALNTEYKNGLSNCKKDVILVSHRAFGYLARDYGFEQIAISGISPESEPTPQEMATLVEEAREHDVKYVFYEELVDPRIAQTIASEVNATALELNPIEGTKNPGEDYFSLMRKNLANLKLALECS
jgi:zinc transport system substrate-binding protein